MKKNLNYWSLSGFTFFYFFASTSAMSLFAIWLGQTLELSGAQVGTVFAINAIATLCFQPLYGFISDKIGLKKHLLWFITFLIMFIGPFFIYVYSPLLHYNIFVGAVIGSIYLSATLLAAFGAIESYAERTGKKYNFEYGQVRMWGSLGAAAAALFSGKLFNINPHISFWIASACSIFLVIFLLLMKVNVSEEEKKKTDSIKLKDTLSLLKNKTFWVFMIYVLGVACVYSVYDQQFPVYYASLFSTREQGNQMFGYLNSIQIFLEAGMMFVAPFIVNKIGPKKALVVAGILMAIRITGSGLAVEPIGISTMKMLHSVELPIMLVAILKFIAANFDAKFSATMYIVGYYFVSQVGQAILSPLLGHWYDTIGFSKTYLMLGVSVFIFVIVFALLKTKTVPIQTYYSKRAG
ncbi:MFS transporter [Priestia megaterium]|uniref:MFS transporter n=1 Tax=Priestia megaterium TaxID=1404 RepID=UPI001B3A2BF6|nr:MFS transporter [Priestia megaterium]MBQ4870295.1 MFS transporter [Priestia megaterium]